MSIKRRITDLLTTVGRGVYEKDAELKLALLSALAGESILLLGPPGVAKSMVARRLKDVFCNARAFEYLMSRFSTPDEIFGPISISKLKDGDRYERTIEGFLPTADVVFLDEIWKAGPAIQNTLLTVLNEKLFRNGDKELPIPLKLFIGASNELPAEGEGLEALWDRFLVRYVSGGIKDDNTFWSMVVDNETYQCDELLKKLQITPEEYSAWQEQIAHIELDNSVRKGVLAIRERIKHIRVGTGEIEHNIYVSDRRWKKIINLLRTSAFIHDRQSTDTSDLILLMYCVWNDPVEQEVVREIVLHSVFAQNESWLHEMKEALKKDLRRKEADKAIRELQQTSILEDRELILYDEYYYRLTTYNTGNTYIYAPDFHHLSDYKTRTTVRGIMMNDKAEPQKERIHTYEGNIDSEGLVNESRKIRLARDKEYLYIDGVRCDLDRYTAKELAERPFCAGTLFANEYTYDYEAEVEKIVAATNALSISLENNIFCTSETRQYIQNFITEFLKNVAYTRVDIRRLLYDND